MKNIKNASSLPKNKNETSTIFHSFFSNKRYRNNAANHSNDTAYFHKALMGRGVKYPSVIPANTNNGIVPIRRSRAFFPPIVNERLRECRPGKIIDRAINNPAAPQTKTQNSSGTPWEGSVTKRRNQFLCLRRRQMRAPSINPLTTRT